MSVCLRCSKNTKTDNRFISTCFELDKFINKTYKTYFKSCKQSKFKLKTQLVNISATT